MPSSPIQPVAWCHAPALPVYARLFPALRWETVPAESGSVDIVTELENRGTTLALAPVRFEDLPKLAQEGWIRPLDAWFTPEQLAIYAPEALALATVGGRLYAIPDDITPFAFFIRASVLKRLNVGPPHTWDEFEVLADRLARHRLPLAMLAGGLRFRQAFLLSLLESNGVTTADVAGMLKDARRAVEAYDWLRRLARDRRLLPLDELTHPRSLRMASPDRRKLAAGFGWLSGFGAYSAAGQRPFVFLPFPRGPSLPAGAVPRFPMKGSGWCMPLSRAQPDEAIAVLRSIHAPQTLRQLGNAEQHPFIAVRARWEDPAVCRRYPVYRYAAGLIGAAEPILPDMPAHVRRLEVTFRNALLDGRDGQAWLDDYGGGLGGSSGLGSPPPIRAVLRAIESRMGQVRGIGEIGRSLGLHPVRLRRLLRRELDERAGAYFRKRRLEEARALLAAGGRSVKQIAKQVGYRNTSAFCRAYARHWGHAPLADRQGAKRR
jgi:AraC-like DNA-binding protein